MSDMKCPFCQQKMRRTNGAHNKVGVWQCQNSNDPDNVCIASGYLFNDDVLNYIASTRKALEIAVDGLLAVWRATEHTTKQGSIAYNVLRDLNIKPLDRIKALEQKDMK